MLKVKSVFFLVMLLSANAFAQTEPSQVEVQKEESSSQFSEFLMHGWSVGLEYAAMDADVKVKLRDGSKFSGHTTESAGAVGISLLYGKLRRNDFGLVFGGSLIRKIENKKDSDVSTLKASVEITQLRPEMSAAYSLGNGVYGMAGAHISLLNVDSDSVEKGGFGLQLVAGFIPARNWGFDVGYFISIHSVREEALAAPIERSESNYAFKQLRARVSYMF